MSTLPAPRFDRRGFLGAASLAAVSSTLSGRLPTRSARKLELLILGGTRFLGPAIVEAAVAAGHEVTLFNRGRSNPHLFPKLETLIGDRDPDVGEGLTALGGRRFDAVIDTSAFVPRIAAASAELLAPNCRHYALVSTVSVYGDMQAIGIDEDDAVGTLEDPATEVVDGVSYGPLKALAEQAVRATFPGVVTVVRPGLIVGPRDATDRFTYWPLRVAKGGEILAPGDGRDPVQYVDVRDLANFLLASVEREVAGTFNVVGPEVRSTMDELVHGCKAVTGGDARFTWVDAEFLAARGVAPWSHMPVWVPRGGGSAGIGEVSNRRALAAGLELSPLADTVRDTLAWTASLPEDHPRRELKALAPEREAELLAAWHAER
ncbi:MAG: SDR family oxidoreductase [Planctomycetota bacterium]